MLKTHQVIGYTTLLAMIAQGIIGEKLYNGNYELYETHKTMGNLINIGYFTSRIVFVCSVLLTLYLEVLQLQF